MWMSGKALRSPQITIIKIFPDNEAFESHFITVCLELLPKYIIRLLP